jgi:hypothetical protein
VSIVPRCSYAFSTPALLIGLDKHGEDQKFVGLTTHGSKATNARPSCCITMVREQQLFLAPESRAVLQASSVNSNAILRIPYLFLYDTKYAFYSTSTYVLKAGV